MGKVKLDTFLVYCSSASERIYTQKQKNEKLWKGKSPLFLYLGALIFRCYKISIFLEIMGKSTVKKSFHLN